ncbi:hypothetical protein DFH28DRAFT_922974 [Melampsora americana]|nr:hypothetical protein DFH28DRAFT_922974 [Melampsora americana]
MRASIYSTRSYTTTIQRARFEWHPNIVAHTAGVSSLFPGMSAQKTKSCPCMNVTTLKMMSQIYINLQSEYPKQTKDHTVEKPNDELKDIQFEDIDQLQEFEGRFHFDDDDDPKDF